MAQTLTPVKEGFKARDLEAILVVLTEMVEKSGHGLAYILNYNLFQGRKVLKEFYEREQEARNGFFEKDDQGKPKQYFYKGAELLEATPENGFNGNEKTVAKIPAEKVDEANKMLIEFNNELLDVNFKQLDENKFNEALENSIFDGIDLTPLFDTLIN